MHLDCVSGAAGDMLLAALLDAGAATRAVDAALAACGVDATVGITEVQRAGLRAARLDIAIGVSERRRARQLGAALAAVDAAALAPRLRTRARAALLALGEAEAALHGVPRAQIHLHELSAVDTLVDIVGVCAALEDLDVTVLTASPLPAGAGTVSTEHGRLPLPAPATLHLLAAAGAPLVPGPAGVELVTPTAAALLTTLAMFGQPTLRLRRVGTGAGTRDDTHRPNVCRAWLGEPLDGTAERRDDAFAEAVVELRANLDDASPAVVAGLAVRCLEAGALDAWVVAATMKKGRPGHILHALAFAGAEASLGALLIDSGATLGVRATAAPRMTAARDLVVVDIDGERVRVKRRLSGGRTVDARPELDDCERIARHRGVALQRVVDDLTAAARRMLVDGDTAPRPPAVPQ